MSRVTDDHAVRRHALLFEHVELAMTDLPEPCVERDRETRAQVRASPGAQDALLGRAQEVAVGAELADDARADAGVADAVLDLGDEAVRELARW